MSIKRTHLLLLIIGMLSLPIIILSCKKKIKYTLSGAVFNKCGEPLANSTLDIRQRGQQYYTKTASGGSIGTVKTDGSGNFKFIYKSLVNGDSLSIFDGTDVNSISILQGIPANSNQQVFAYKEMKIDLHIITSVAPFDSLFTYHDSLVIGGQYFFMGAFHEGQDMGTVSIKADVSHFDYAKKDYALVWGIGIWDYWVNLNTYNHYNEDSVHIIHYKLNGCDGDNKVTIAL